MYYDSRDWFTNPDLDRPGGMHPKESKNISFSYDSVFNQ